MEWLSHYWIYTDVKEKDSVHIAGLDGIVHTYTVDKIFQNDPWLSEGTGLFAAGLISEDSQDAIIVFRGTQPYEFDFSFKDTLLVLSEFIVEKVISDTLTGAIGNMVGYIKYLSELYDVYDNVSKITDAYQLFNDLVDAQISYADILSNLDSNGMGWSQFYGSKDGNAKTAQNNDNLNKNTDDTYWQIRDWAYTQQQKNRSISVTGHSLGGTLAQMFASEYATGPGHKIENLVTFQSGGIAKSFLNNDRWQYCERIVHYVAAGDLASMCGNGFFGADKGQVNICYADTFARDLWYSYNSIRDDLYSPTFGINPDFFKTCQKNMGKTFYLEPFKYVLKPHEFFGLTFIRDDSRTIEITATQFSESTFNYSQYQPNFAGYNELEYLVTSVIEKKNQHTYYEATHSNKGVTHLVQWSKAWCYFLQNRKTLEEYRQKIEDKSLGFLNGDVGLEDMTRNRDMAMLYLILTNEPVIQDTGLLDGYRPEWPWSKSAAVQSQSIQSESVTIQSESVEDTITELLPDETFDNGVTLTSMTLTNGILTGYLTIPNNSPIAFTLDFTNEESVMILNSNVTYNIAESSYYGKRLNLYDVLNFGTVNPNQNIYQWKYANGNVIETEKITNNNGKFTFDASLVGQSLYCVITNPFLSGFTLNTSMIAITNVAPPSVTTPTVSTPTNIQSYGFAIDWQDAENSIGYFIQISTTPAFTNETTAERYSKNSNYTFYDLDGGTEYYVRVKSIANEEYSDSVFSDTITVTTAAPPVTISAETIQTTDTNSNSFYDTLTASITVNATIAGTYGIYGYLYTKDGNVTSQYLGQQELIAGDNTFNFVFNGEDIFYSELN
jgi:hypothetical protein